MIFLVGIIVGYGIGLFAFSNIVLPLLFAWPRARRLHRQGLLTRPIPSTRFLIAPVVWGTITLGSVWIASRFSENLAQGYMFGLLIGLVQIVRLLFSPNKDMDADFADTFGDFMKDSAK